MTSTGGIENKWSHLTRISQSNGVGHQHKIRNHPLRNQKAAGGLTHDFGGSLSSHDYHKRPNEGLKGHKLSCDDSLYNRRIMKQQYSNDSPGIKGMNNKFSQNEMLKEYMGSTKAYTSPALMQIEKNLESYFSSNEYPYNEIRSFLENNTSMPYIKQEKQSQNDIDLSPLKLVPEGAHTAKMPHLDNQIEENVNNDFSTNRTTAFQSLELIRKEIKEFLAKEQQSPTAKILQVISNIYESNISLRDYEISQLLTREESSDPNSIRMSKPTVSNRDQGTLNCFFLVLNFIFVDRKEDASNTSKLEDSKRSKKIKVLKYSNIEYADEKCSDKNLQKVGKMRKKSQTSAGF